MEKFGLSQANSPETPMMITPSLEERKMENSMILKLQVKELQ
jgi:hypothetical protein